MMEFLAANFNLPTIMVHEHKTGGLGCCDGSCGGGGCGGGCHSCGGSCHGCDGSCCHEK